MLTAIFSRRPAQSLTTRLFAENVGAVAMAGKTSGDHALCETLRVASSSPQAQNHLTPPYSKKWSLSRAVMGSCIRY